MLTESVAALCNAYSSVDPRATLPPLPDWLALPPALHLLFTD